MPQAGLIPRPHPLRLASISCGMRAGRPQRHRAASPVVGGNRCRSAPDRSRDACRAGDHRGRWSLLPRDHGDYARPGEGKTFAALNIAASIAAGSTMPVLLVDTDGKHGSISDLLGCADQEGLRALAADPARYPLRIISTALERVSFLPFGAAPSGVPLVPSSKRSRPRSDC